MAKIAPCVLCGWFSPSRVPFLPKRMHVWACLPDAARLHEADCLRFANEIKIPQIVHCSFIALCGLMESFCSKCYSPKGFLFLMFGGFLFGWPQLEEVTSCWDIYSPGTVEFHFFFFFLTSQVIQSKLVMCQSWWSQLFQVNDRGMRDIFRIGKKKNVINTRQKNRMNIFVK